MRHVCGYISAPVCLSAIITYSLSIAEYWVAWKVRHQQISKQLRQNTKGDRHQTSPLVRVRRAKAATPLSLLSILRWWVHCSNIGRGNVGLKVSCRILKCIGRLARIARTSCLFRGLFAQRCIIHLNTCTPLLLHW